MSKLLSPLSVDRRLGRDPELEAIVDWLTRLTDVLNNKFEAPVVLPTHLVAALPSAVTHVGSLIYVSDEAGGAIPAFSDGVNWRRVTDRAVVS